MLLDLECLTGAVLVYILYPRLRAASQHGKRAWKFVAGYVALVSFHASRGCSTSILSGQTMTSGLSDRFEGQVEVGCSQPFSITR